MAFKSIYWFITSSWNGLRLKLNKHSNTNLAIDYAVGMNGSRGFFQHWRSLLKIFLNILSGHIN